MCFIQCPVKLDLGSFMMSQEVERFPEFLHKAALRYCSVLVNAESISDSSDVFYLKAPFSCTFNAACCVLHADAAESHQCCSHRPAAPGLHCWSSKLLWQNGRYFRGWNDRKIWKICWEIQRGNDFLAQPQIFFKPYFLVHPITLKRQPSHAGIFECSKQLALQQMQSYQKSLRNQKHQVPSLKFTRWRLAVLEFHIYTSGL